MNLADFGIARVYKTKNSHETSGTPCYMAPEVLNHQNHTIAVDYYALGVVTYELIFGERPLKGKSKQEIRENLMGKQICIKQHEAPKGISSEAIDFINKVFIM